MFVLAAGAFRIFTVSAPLSTTRVSGSHTFERMPICARSRPAWSSSISSEALRGAGAGADLFFEDADNFEPGVIDFHELAGTSTVAEDCDLGLFAEDTDGSGGKVVVLVEEATFRQFPRVDGRIGGSYAEEFREVRRGIRKDLRGVHAAASGDHLEIVNIGFEYADVALGKAGRRPAALLQFLIAGGGARFDQEVANAEGFDETQGLLASAGADREHADDGTNSEDDTQRGEQRSCLLSPEIGGGQSNVRAVPGQEHVVI